MKAYELLQQVKDMVGASATGRDSAILQKLNITEVSLFNLEYHWRALESYEDITTIAHQAYSDVPSDMGTLYDLRQMTVSPYAKVRYVHPYKLHDYVPQPTIYAESKPIYYTWFGGRIWWYPIPDAAYTMTAWYYKKPVGLGLYTAGSATVSGTALTGTATLWKTGANVTAGQYFAYPRDIKQDGTYPWALIKTVTSDTVIVLTAAYTGATASGAYVISSQGTFDSAFDPYILYNTAIFELGRHVELKDLREMLIPMIAKELAGLINSQTALPDFTDGVQDFAREPILLGDDYAKFPFIQGNP